jgi:glycosyltransferase involved in cell wall biosynthesis
MAVVLYDGWPLWDAPNSAAAIHLLTLLEHSSGKVEAIVALPGESFHSLPAGVDTLRQPVQQGGELQQLNWEQRLLPRLANRLEKPWLHLTGEFAPLFGSFRRVLSPAGRLRTPVSAGEPARSEWQAQGAGAAARLRHALGGGGEARAAAILWPEGFGEPPAQYPLVRLPPAVNPRYASHSAQEAGAQISGLELPETYVLYHGSGSPRALNRLLAAWSWAAGPVGEYYPLLALGLSEDERRQWQAAINETDLAKTISLLPALEMPALAQLYRSCSALLHLGPLPVWDGPVQAALACGKPIVAEYDPWVGAVVGPAAYLVKPGGTPAGRALGAALITVLIEQDVADRLADAARARVSGWGSQRFGGALVSFYEVGEQAGGKRS